MDEKLAISLVSLGVGWLLAQGTDWVRSSRKRKRTETNLLDELRDIDQLMIQALLAHARELQCASHARLEPTTASQVGAVIFDNAFGEAAQDLGQSQRLSYMIIHNLRSHYNQLISERRDMLLEAQRTMTQGDRARATEFVTRGDQSAEALYRTAMEIRWHVRFHLDHSDVPHLDLFGDVHRSYLVFQRELRDEVARIRREAATIDPNSLSEPFDERSFEAMARGFRGSQS